MRHVLATICIFLTGICILWGQKVGINTQNPSEVLHVRTDTNKLAIRLDNKKSAGGFNRYSVNGVPSGLSTHECFVSSNFICENWTPLSFGAITESDSIYLQSPMLPAPVLTGFLIPSIDPGVISKKLRITFQMAGTIPTNANIENVKIEIEYHTLSCTPNYFVPCPELTASAVMFDEDSTGFIFFASPFVFETTTTDQIQVLTSTTLINITPADFNSGTITMLFSELLNMNSPLTPQLNIDRIRLRVNYTAPATGSENTFWSTGIKEGNFTIANSTDLTSPILTIDETGTTRLKGLQITEDAGAGKVLYSTTTGTAYWGSLPTSLAYWRLESDTLTSVPFPTEIPGALHALQGMKLGHTLQLNEGNIRYNPDLRDFEGYNGAKWLSLSNNTGFGDKLGHEDQDVEGGSQESSFGKAMDMDDSFCINASDSIVHFYEYANGLWDETASFPHPDVIGDVAIDGDYAAVTHGDSAIFYFRDGGTWSVQARYALTPQPDPWYVDLYGIRASFVNKDANNCFILKRTGTSWDVEDNLIMSNSTYDPASISMTHDRIIIGGFPAGQNVEGLAWILTRNSADWAEDTILMASDAAPADHFGASVCLGADWAVVGADGFYDTSPTAAYFFKLGQGGWDEKAKITGSTSEPRDKFGRQVHINKTGKYAIVGAPTKGTDPSYMEPGKAYVFTRTGNAWTETGILTPGDGMESDLFGNAVAITNNAAVVGAPNISPNGKVYFFLNH